MDELLNGLQSSGIHPIRPAFFPVSSPEGRPNCKRNFVVHRDGSFTERVVLQTSSAEHREELICLHYIKHCNMLFWKSELRVNVISRDDPWDFRIEIPEIQNFNIEITSIAEHDARFRFLKHEERFASASRRDKITLHELKKLEDRFPNARITEMIQLFTARGLKKNDLVPNPYLSDGPNLFVGSFVPDPPSLQYLIESAIVKKEAKKHPDKDQTILLIDNRLVTYDAPDFHDASENIRDLVAASSFKEIWLYTGYFSDDDGNNAEFCLIPFKTTSDRISQLADAAAEKGLDEHHRLIL